MAKIELNKTIIIPAKIEDVFAKINDFHHWSSWSPWLIMEREATVKVNADGKYYSWEGTRIGSGEMQITDEKLNERVAIDLTFLKPWKSKAKVWFEVKEKGAETQVTWYMKTSLPFFMFWMKKMMTAYLGMDFERGLRLLKDYVLDGEVHSAVDIIGIVAYDGCRYVGIKKTSDFEQLGPDMTALFTKLAEVSNEKFTPKGSLSITHKWDMVNRKTTYTAALIVDEIPTNLPTSFVSGEIPATKVHSLRHKGRYDHLGNAWGMQSMFIRNKAFKHNAKIDPFEVYRNSPQDTPVNDLITDVNFPVK